MFTRIFEGIEHMFMFSDKAKYDSWKKEALAAKNKGLTIRCGYCNGLIFPGQSVTEDMRGGVKIIAHAGFHYILDSSEAALMCEKGSFSIGHWNGKEIIKTCESAAAKTVIPTEMVENHHF